jgi:hypothetical protein
MKTKLSLICI